MLGTTRIWSQQVDKLLEESKMMLTKQATYNMIIQTEIEEEERRKKRVNYVEMLEGTGTHKKKKKTHASVAFTVNDFERFEETLAANQQNEVFSALTFNTAPIDQITLRETNFLNAATTFAQQDEIVLNEFEPLAEEEINQFFVENENYEKSQEINVDQTRGHASNRESIDFHVETRVEPEIPENSQMNQVTVLAEIHAEPRDLAMELPPLIEIPEIITPKVEFDKIDVVEPVPDPEEPQNFIFTPKPEPFERENIKNVSEMFPSEIEPLKLQKLDKKSVVKPKSKAKRGKKRKIDEVTFLSRDQMLSQMKDYSDIVLPGLSLQPTKKLKTAQDLIRSSGHANRDRFSAEMLTKQFETKIKFLSLTETTRKRKLKAASASKGEPAKKKPRKPFRLTASPEENFEPQATSMLVNVENVIQSHPEVSEVNPENPPIIQEKNIRNSLPPPEEFFSPEMTSNLPNTRNIGDIVQNCPEMPEISPPIPPSMNIIEQIPIPTPPPENFTPELDTFLKELLPETPTDELLVDPRTIEARNITKWKAVRQAWGHIPLLKKFIRIFHQNVLTTTIEALIQQERTKMVGTMTFSSVIRKYFFFRFF